MAFPFGSWRQLVAGIRSKGRRSKNHWPALRPKLGLEHLEDRRLLSVSQVFVHPNRTLQILGSDQADQATVSLDTPTLVGVHYERDGLPMVDYFNRSLFDSIVFVGNAGDDQFTNLTTINSVAYGGDGNDILQGGMGVDTLFGDGGNDLLMGVGGDDYLYGGDGNDELRGGGGNDRLRGDTGNDLLYGHAGDDSMFGDAGIDLLFGGDGNDVIFGGDDDDRLSGGLGNDRLNGDGGNDSLAGNEGHDALLGGAGNDRLWGNDGNDTLEGQADDDLLYGGAGSDNLYGHDGKDSLYGEDGDDYLSGGAGNDYLSGGEGSDRLVGNEGADHLVGDAGDDLLAGNDDNDVLEGGAGDDELYGGAHSDLLLGGDGADELFGEAGNDVLIGGAAVDLVLGNAGEDLLVGGTVSHTAAVLKQLVAAWNNGTAYESRVELIENELFAAHLQSQHTVFDDYVADTVYGNEDRDWFFLPAIMATYDPVGQPPEEDQEQTGGHNHSPTIVYELPPVEGFGLIDSFDKFGDKQTDEFLHTLIPHAEDPVRQREHLALFELVRYDQVTHTAVASGNWSNPSTWANGVVPAAGARVLIPVGVEVKVDRVISPRHFSIRVDGTLSFATNVNTYLRVDTMVVSNVGRLEIGTAAQPVAANVAARLVFTGPGPINRVYDPFGISRGLITHGSVSMHGAAVTSYGELSGSVTAGTSVLNLTQVPVGWKVGDQIVIAGSTSGVVQDELRQILAITGNQIIIQPLAYSHVTPSPDLKVHVANVTRNVVLESENTEVSQRGHVMFMHNRDVEVHYTAFNRLGRTDKFTPVNDPVVDANWKLVAGTGTNPRGRYPVHFHRNGTTIDGNPSVVEGSVVVDSHSWGFVNHSSYVQIADNVTYNVDGAGFVTEVGDETGSFERNIALSTFASGEEINSRNAIQDFGHTGDGFWFQGAGISVVDNIAAGAEGSAFSYYTRGLREGDAPQAHYLTANLPDPSIAQGAETLLVDFVPVREFRGNVGYGSSIGLTVRYNLLDATHTVQSVLQDSTFWNNPVGVDVPYSHRTVLRNLKVVYDTSWGLGNVGVDMNGQTKDTVYENLTVTGYNRGINVTRQGTSIVSGGTFVAREAIVIRPPTSENRVVLITGPIVFGELPPGLTVPGLTEVRMLFDLAPVANSPDYSHLFYNNSVILNYGPHSMRKAYFLEQAATAIPFPEHGAGIPPEYVGLTTLQLQALPTGGTIGGQLAPLVAATDPAIYGLLDP